jgi:hypothetical protein
MAEHGCVHTLLPVQILHIEIKRHFLLACVRSDCLSQDTKSNDIHDGAVQVNADVAISLIFGLSET